MSSHPLDLVFIGLSITSTWGNGHATTYRALVRSLARLGHRVLFLERDVRADMVLMGYSPSVRLFEAASCGTPIISDPWLGLGSFFELGQEILVANSPIDVLRLLHETPPDRARAIGERARERLLAEHTSEHRAAQLEDYLASVRRDRAPFLARGQHFNADGPVPLTVRS
jgi:spore maturation protein CgeB